jgi:hypothetical protein
MSSPETESNPNYPLPVVSEQTAQAVMDDIETKGPHAYLGAEFQDFYKNNTVAAEAVMHFMRIRQLNATEQLLVMDVVALTHELLKHAAADNTADTSSI